MRERLAKMRASGSRAPRRARVAFVALVVAGTVLLPLLVFGVLLRETLDNDLVRRGQEQRAIAARVAADLIAQILTDVAHDLDLLASSPGVRAALRHRDARTLEGRLADLALEPNVSSALALDPSGVMLARYPATPELYGQSFADRDYYRGAVAGRGSYVSKVFASRAPGSPTFVGVGLAVREGGDLVGVLQATVAPSRLIDLVGGLGSVEGRSLVIVDAGGSVVASTDADLMPLQQVTIPQAGPNTPVLISGKERLVTTAGIAGAHEWTLYVMDTADVALAGERTLAAELTAAGLAAGLLALVAAAVVAALYYRTERQRAELLAIGAALADTNAALETASHHKSEFLASMSHELRTPLNAILGFSDLLSEQVGAALSERQRRYLANIGEAGRHLLGLINDVLDLSKVEAGRVELRPERTTIADLCAPVLAATRAAAAARGVAFESQVDGGVQVFLDAGRIRQILYNLLSNAVKFTDPGGRVEARVREDGGALGIEVSDTGIGIPDPARERVFGTFERLHEGRSDASGTGLGLALTKRLVDLHGGSIAFTSEVGQGTTFRVRLPNVALPEPPADRVLVVEDDRRDADLLVALVQQAGLVAEVVASAAAAIDSIRRAPPRAVVLDLRLPDGRGERVLEELRKGEATRGVPVIVVTVEDDDGGTRGLGADDHLTKPIDPQRLARWLARVAGAEATA